MDLTIHDIKFETLCALCPDVKKLYAKGDGEKYHTSRTYHGHCNIENDKGETILTLNLFAELPEMPQKKEE